MNVFIRADASVEIGTGHIMRCLTLAEELREMGCIVSFICRKLPGNLITYVKKVKQFPIIELPLPSNTFSRSTSLNHAHWLGAHWKEDVSQTTAALAEKKADWMIIDHYGIDYHWEREIKSFVSRIMVIDDLADRAHICDVLLDQNLYKNPTERYNHLVPKETIQLLGPSYALLRAEFRDARKKLRKRSGKVNRILISFGGSDPTNETLKALEGFLQLQKPEIKVDVVVGETNRNRTIIETVCQEHPNITFHCQIDYMAQLMAEADLAIGALGSSTWERCYLELPSLVILAAENQYGLSEQLVEEGIIVNLGRAEDVKAGLIAMAVQEMMNDPESLRHMALNARNLFPEESTSALLSMFNRKGGS
ncbi:UDP-2,4-diacetamido-2,4,6-trideoxy-beta-L-altropyranose hydrolase [Halobacillus salinarum]|uniref:UDP-2,4-diacetamido-2,4, 6-trideoxy-beta-L-altropyranose hydrolase n=1 Tax=Halobacillus salinarum TaxID=2932257 RepID=A0ABY4EI19_9BACI|nr:UDP-2,4-diacetamido-2,4,6-trideoxy-beta-L-altropyranose hydrolase [Halobacillus salinarum]UOQ44121.1 UDP-2,4-diacetamido-2,4,6-trideoxy-beta-L-altropyranose hydrolase [Halobacillus salinarum]